MKETSKDLSFSRLNSSSNVQKTRVVVLRYFRNVLIKHVVSDRKKTGLKETSLKETSLMGGSL
jgi:hypothetical protein